MTENGLPPAPTPDDAAPAATPASVDRRPIAEVRALSVHFVVRHGVLKRHEVARVRAVDGVSLRIDEGMTFGLVGESGSGKSTLGRVIMGIIPPTEGSVRVGGVELRSLKRNTRRRHRRTVQIVFQDPFSSLDPRMSVGSIIAEPLTSSEDARGSRQVRERVAELLDMVGLPRGSAKKYPHQFSGGQRQRIAIARALAPNPRLIVLDEPTSALDVSIRAQILNLLKDLQASMGLSYIIISHDLATVAQLADEVGVMYLGRIVEIGPTAEIFRAPSHPYTQALLSSIPDDQPPSAPRLAENYEIPTAMRIPAGCRFKGGCMLRRELGSPAECDEIDPQLRDVSPGHRSACHFAEQALETEWR